MGEHVLRQAAGIGEGLAAGGTDAEDVFGMGSNVLRQAAGL